MIIRKFVLAVGAAAAACLIVPAVADDPEPTEETEDAAEDSPASFTAISPIFGQLVRFSVPTNFVAAFEDANAERYIRESVPKGETVESWSQMITVTGVKGLANNVDTTPKAFAASITGGFKQACPDSYAENAVGPTKFGAHEAFVTIASCGSVKPPGGDERSETALIIAIKGDADYYSLQWAERADAATDGSLVEDDRWTERLEQLGPVRLCRIVPGEEMPYPSCLAGE